MDAWAYTDVMDVTNVNKVTDCSLIGSFCFSRALIGSRWPTEFRHACALGSAGAAQPSAR